MYILNIYNFLKMCKHEKILKENIQKKDSYWIGVVNTFYPNFVLNLS